MKVSQRKFQFKALQPRLLLEGGGGGGEMGKREKLVKN